MSKTAEAAKRVLTGSVLEPYRAYRSFIGLLGFALPFLVMVWALSIESSISAYYHTRSRNIFVGILCVIGVFLAFYKFSPYRPDQPGPKVHHLVRSGDADTVLGKLAGILAIVVAFVPTTPPPSSPIQPPIIGKAHGFAAALLFICLSLFPLKLFSLSKHQPRVHKWIGRGMLAAIALIFGYTVSPEAFRIMLAPARPVFLLETAAIALFATSWWLKGREPSEPTGEPPATKEHREPATA